MSIHKIVDSTLRLIISVLFRILLIVYSLSILLRVSNYFPWYVYVVGTVFYIVFYFLLFNKEKLWSFLRLLNDYLFFLLILYKKDINDFHTVTLLILPILNTLNHSSKSQKQLFSYKLYLLTIISFFILRGFHFKWGDIVALSAVALINLFIYVRTSLIEFNNELYDLVDSFYTKNLKIGRIFEVLILIREKLNSNKKLFNSKEIVCFRIQENSMRVLNGTSFIISFKIKDEKNFLDSVIKEKYLLDQTLEINGVNSTRNIFFLNTLNGMNYLYFIELESRIPKVLWKYFYSPILEPLFLRITRVFDIEQEINNERKRNMDKIKSKMLFVESTIKAIHFLNNKLTPIKNYFKMVGDYDKLKEEDPIRAKLLPGITEEKKIAIGIINPIINRMKDILRKSSNPFIVSEIEKVSLRRVFTIVRKDWDDDNLRRECLKANWPLNVYDRVVILNIDVFQFLIEELLINLKKHSKTFYEVDFNIENDQPIISFSDDVRQVSSNSKSDFADLVADFNSPIISEKMKRKSYGLPLMKQALQQLNLQYKLSLKDGDIFELKIFFNTV